MKFTEPLDLGKLLHGAKLYKFLCFGKTTKMLINLPAGFTAFIILGFYEVYL